MYHNSYLLIVIQLLGLFPCSCFSSSCTSKNSSATDRFIYKFDKLDSTELSRVVVGVIMAMYSYPPTCLKKKGMKVRYPVK